MTPGHDCIFDEIIAGTRPAFLVLDEPDLVGFLDVRPVFEGHTLVVPRRHVSTIGELPARAARPVARRRPRVAERPTDAPSAPTARFSSSTTWSARASPMSICTWFPAGAATASAAFCGPGPATPTTPPRPRSPAGCGPRSTAASSPYGRGPAQSAADQHGLMGPTPAQHHPAVVQDVAVVEGPVLGHAGCR